MKKKNIILIGAGGHAGVVLDILLRDFSNNFKPIGYMDVEDKGNFKGLKYLGDDKELVNIYKNGICKDLIIGIGYIEINSKRRRIIESLLNIGFEFPKMISKKASVSKDTIIREGTVIFDNVAISSGAEIGKFCILNTGSIVEHDSLIGDFSHISPGAVICGGAKIGENSIIGANATVIQYRNICENVFVGAGAVVVKDIKKNGVYAGIPAKKL